MADERTYPMIEIVGISDDSISQAVRSALARATETIRNIEWFEVSEIRGVVDKGKPTFQVTVKLGFRYE